MSESALLSHWLPVSAMLPCCQNLYCCLTGCRYQQCCPVVRICNALSLVASIYSTDQPVARIYNSVASKNTTLPLIARIYSATPPVASHHPTSCRYLEYCPSSCQVYITVCGTIQSVGSMYSDVPLDSSICSSVQLVAIIFHCPSSIQ